MIVESANTLRHRYARLNEAEKVKNRLQQITDTRTRLEEIQPCFGEPIAIFGLTQDRLPDADRERIGQRITELEEMIRRSRKEFDRERRQVTRLDEGAGRANSLVRELDAAWQVYSERQRQPYHEILVLVRQLGGFAEPAQSLQHALQALLPLTSVVPKSNSQLAHFDSQLLVVKQRAEAFKDLPTAVQEFLRRVVAHSATLEDLSPDVSEWFRDQGLLRSFAIRFGSET